MKNKHMYSLLDPTFTTVDVQFWQDNPVEAPIRIKARGRTARSVVGDDIDENDDYQPLAKTAYRTYTYKAPKAMGLALNDKVLVLSATGLLKIVVVVKVDPQPVIDVDADFDYKWIVQRVDMGPYNELVARERLFQENMLDVERVRQRESLVNSFRESLPVGSAARDLFERTTGMLLGPQGSTIDETVQNGGNN